MKNEKQQQAHNLYFQTNLSQTQIANILDVDRKTIFNWMTEGNWRQLKKSAHHIPSKIVEQQYYMLANMNYEILSRGHQPYPLTHEVKQMRYLTLCIKDLKNKQTVNESIEAYTHLAEHISHTNPELAASLRPFIQDYIAGRAKVKFAECMPEDFISEPKMDEMFDYEIRPADDDDPNFHFGPTNDDGGQPAPTDPLPTPPTPSHTHEQEDDEDLSFTSDPAPALYEEYTPSAIPIEVEAHAASSFSSCATPPAPPVADVTSPSPPVERAGVRSWVDPDDLDAAVAQSTDPTPSPITPITMRAAPSPSNCKVRPTIRPTLIAA